jgi:CDP-diacylglycerol---glycerol-3-phosphate 3-phosphatidyltransferase
VFKHGELIGLPFCQPIEYGRSILGHVSMGKVSLFGSIYDIAANRVVENVLWVVLANLDLVPVWVALVFVTRGILVDAVRSVGASHGSSPFSLTRPRLGAF